MASHSTPTPVTSTTPIAIKILFEGSNRRLKLPMGDLGPTKLPEKVRTVLHANLFISSAPVCSASMWRTPNHPLTSGCLLPVDASV